MATSAATTTLASLCLAGLLAAAPSVVAAQFDSLPVPEAMATLDFMVGDWTVDGAFRTPDHIGSDGTLWYLTRGGGVTRFDGRAWTAFRAGESPAADSVRGLITGRGAPYAFSNELSVRRIQDGFALLLDEGRTSGSTVIFFDTKKKAWIATAFHAPTNGISTSIAAGGDGLPVFEGRATDRRGPRIFRRRYERQGDNGFTIRTSVSFDEGMTWIDDQIVQRVKRRPE